MERNGKHKVNKIKRFVSNNTGIIVMLLFVCMVATFFVSVYLIRQSVTNNYYSIINTVYKYDEAAAKELVHSIYRGENNPIDESEAKKILTDIGYREEDIKYSRFVKIMSFSVPIAIFSIAGIVLILLFINNKNETEKKLLEEKEKLLRELENSHLAERQFIQKKNAMTQNYVENVAHQVRTPLTNIMLNMDMICSDEKNKEIFEECNYHISRVNNLMERLLKIGRFEAGKIIMNKQEERLDRILLDIISNYNVNSDFEELSLYCDAKWLYEAFSCLIENCVDHNKANTPVTVRMKTSEDKVVVLIEDEGDGFRKEDIPYIFERFYSVEKAGSVGHYGIGLNLAKMIIEEHYEKVSAYNKESGGAGFKVELPILKLKIKKLKCH